MRHQLRSVFIQAVAKNTPYGQEIEIEDDDKFDFEYDKGDIWHPIEVSYILRRN